METMFSEQPNTRFYKTRKDWEDFIARKAYLAKEFDCKTEVTVYKESGGEMMVLYRRPDWQVDNTAGL